MADVAFFFSLFAWQTRTEGMMDPEIFPMNYFSFRTVFGYEADTAIDSFVEFVRKYHAESG